MSNPYSLKGKKAFVTGGKRRIGRGIALALAEAGCDVGINDLTLDQDGEETLRLVRACGREAEFFEGDISDASQVERMFRAVSAKVWSHRYSHQQSLWRYRSRVS
ncbi:MAG: SDR family NAD(P)-dependent oxidoreductase [Candidatus Poribacteria bacterium]